MLDVVNRLADGFVAAAVIQSFHRGGVFRALAETRQSTGSLAGRCRANGGHLRVALRLLDGLGWVDGSASNEVWLTELGMAAARTVPLALGAMLSELPGIMEGDGAALAAMFDRCAEGWVDTGAHPKLAPLLDGALLTPVLVELVRRGGARALEAGENPFTPSATDAMLRLFAANGWAEPAQSRPQLNPAGRFLIDSGAKLGVVASYWPMLQQMDALLFGDAAAVFSRDEHGHERHLDRRQNIFGSTAQHGSFFREMEDRVVAYFESLPLEAQPTHIADLGCGDGSLLKGLFQAVVARTRRGAALDRFPLTLVAADFNRSSLDAARHNLTDLPHVTIQADIGNPADYVAALNASGVDPQGVLHVRSFVDHDRPLVPIRDTAAIARRDAVGDTGVHVDDAGGWIATPTAVQSLAEHLARWRDVQTQHGLLILEVHCLPPATVRQLDHATEALHFDAYHAFSRQHLVEAPTFLLMAAEAGLVPQSRSALRVPRLAPYTRITLNRLAPRPYRIRLATNEDVGALLALEHAAASADLRSSEEQIRRRIGSFPKGQLLVELDGRLIGAIYTQRIAGEADLDAITFGTVENLHRDDGAVGQLLWVLSDPAHEDRAHVEELLDFAIDYLATMPGVDRVVGVTRCRDYATRSDTSLSHEAYVKLRDAIGLPIDPVLLMHASHGARIERVLSRYRPHDRANEGAGVLIAYSVDDRYAVAKPAAAAPRIAGGDLETIVRESVERVLGVARSDAYQRDRALMSMGLESLELLELRRILANALGAPLDPTFFFRHGTPAAVIRYFAEQAAPTPATPAVIAKPPAERRSGESGFAIVGLACRMPGADESAAAFWRLLEGAGDAVRDISPERWQMFEQADRRAAGLPREGALLAGIDRFDAAFFSISPREAASLDPQQRLLLQTTWEALENAGIAPSDLAGTETGLFVGLMGHDYETLLLQAGADDLDGHFATGNSGSIAAGRIAHFFDWHGPAVTIDTACSSSLVAIHQACRALRAGDCTAAIAGGANLTLAPLASLSYLRAGMLSPDGRCKTFDASANGYGRGEGVGVVVLKRLEDAERDGDRVLAVIRGSAVNQDGTGIGLTAPNETAQQKLIEAALADAQLAPSDVSYLEAHGTGTSLGDPIEVGAASRAYGVGRGVDRPLLLGSVKANIGHLEAAAGVAGLIKVVLSLQAGELPGQVHFREPNPHVAWGSLPVEVVRARRAWPSGRRIAGISSFGFSGTNAHVIVEGYAEPVAAEPLSRQAQVLALSAKSGPALSALIERYAAFVAENASVSLADLCFTAGVGRNHFGHRASVVAETRDELVSGLAGLVPSAPRRGPARVGVLFTGQGSQWAGMAQGVYAGEPVFRDVVDRCCAAADALGLHARPLRAVLLAAAGTPEAALLDETAYTQVALYALQCGLWSLFRSWGIEAQAVLGHSVGEFAASYASGVLTLEDGARLVAQRGALMGRLPSGGAMAVVFAAPEAVTAAIERSKGLSLAAENGTHRVVSGPAALVDALVAEFTQAGVRCQRLTVSHAFHSALLDPMLDDLETAAASVTHRAPELALISNLTGSAFAPGTHPDAAYWRRHARAPVLFAQGVAALAAQGVDVLLELGPRPVLSGLALGCWPGVTPGSVPVALSALRPGVPDERALAEAVAGLYAAGGRVEFAGYAAGRGGRRIALPSYPFERVRHWMDAPRSHPRRDAGHPLLGVEHGSASGEVSWTQELSATEPGWVADHAVFGSVVAPGALHACLAAAAGVPAAVRTGQIHAPLVLGEAPVTLQLLLAAADDAGQRGWRVFARPTRGAANGDSRGAANGDSRGAANGDSRGAANGGAPAETAWRLHASGMLSAATGAAPADAPLSGLAERDVEAFYASLAALGLDYGPSFRGIERLWGGDGVARGEIAAPDGVVGAALHPAVLDACFQVLMAALPRFAQDGFADGAARDPIVPLGWDAIEVWGPAPARVVCEARVRGSASGEAVVADLVLQDAAGAAFARVEGLLLKRTTRQAMLGAASGIDELLYEIAWRETEVPAFTAGFVAGPETAAAAVRPLLGALAAETGFDAGRHAAVETLLARASQVYAALALHRLGWSPAAGSVVTAPSLQAELGVLAEHTRLFARLLGLLGEAGLLTQAGESWRVVSWPDAEAAASALAPAAAPFAGEIAWVMLSRCGAALADVLRGRVAPLGLLFPEQDVGAAELYRDAPMFRLMNALLRSAVERLVAARPAGRRLRVLEVGAGTGGTTASLLPLLPRERTTYVYTDVSAGFFAAAETRFAQTYPFVEFRMLDIERDPVAQGFSAGGYDLVVASNVLHATRDLVATTSYCRSLLAPGGALVLLEEMRRRGWVDLTFGLLDGWWRFADPALRPEHALLDPAGWRTALHAAGYGEVATLHPDAAEVQGVVIARSPMQAAAAQAGLWLIAADTPRSGAGVGEALAAALAAHGQRVVLAGATDGPPEPSGSRPTNALIERRRVRPGDAADWRALLASLSGQAGGELRGVVHLAALDAGAADPTTPMLAQQAETVVGSALALSQALIGHDASPTAGLWFVTHGAQVVAGEPASGLAGAALWGMARSLAHEHPELHVRRLDLDAPAAQLAAPVDELVDEPVDELVDELVAALIDELMAPDAEDEIARRGPARLAPRLIRAGQPDADRLAIPADAGWRLAKGAERTLASLTTERVPLAPPGHGEVQVAIEAAGLNFRDVLDALGMVPVDAGPLGGEFAGRVLATGPGVTGFAPGDRVVGLGVGCFADRITTPAALLAPWPGDLPPAAAAALPIVYVTAAIAFELAGLRPGDRVLIHAGAGGVGLAAIALAQAAGAEIFATASAAKQATLRALGVRHVHDSRSTAFGPEILAATGGQGVDMVLNSLTGEGFIAATLSALAPGGRFVEIAKRGIWTHEAMAQARPDVAYHILAVDRLQAEQPEQTGAALRAVLARIGAGELPPLPYASTPMTDARAAMRHMQQARHIGKIVLTAPYVVASNVAAPIRPGVTYLITGGLGGIGLAVADWLADRGATHLALNGRRAPDAPAEAAVAALRARGTTVELILADVAKPTEVDRLIADIDARMPPLAGVIHSVGLLRDGAVANQDWTRFAEVLGPKMLGAWQLHRATRHRALDLFVLFASTVGVLGNRGQSNHAAANVFLDQLANHRRAQGLPGLSIDWGAWSDIGEAAERRTTLEASLQAAGIGWITPTQGLAALDRALASTTPQLAIVNAHWQTQTQTPLLTLLLETKQTQTKTKTQTTPITQRLNRLPQTQRRTELKTWLAQSIQKLLRLPQQPDTEMRFSELGLDSLMSVELRNRLNADLKLDPPLAATVLFDSPNLDALAELIEARLGLAEAPTPEEPTPQPALQPALQTAPTRQADAAIAIIGVAARLPGAIDVAAYWRLVSEGRDATREVPSDRFDINDWYDADPSAPGKIYTRRGGFLDRVDLFDAAFFNISALEAESMDPQQRLLLETAWQAIEHAGVAPESLSGSQTGVFVGVSTNDYVDLLKRRGPEAIDAYRGTGTMHSVAAGRLSYVLGLQGPAVMIDTACSSSLVATHQACQALRAGECNAALVGGVNVILAPEMMLRLSRSSALSPDGRCKTFDASANGYGRGEGVGVVVLKRLEDAERDGDRILAVIRGSAVNQDGASGGLTVPSGPAQERLIEAALAKAGLEPSQVSYLEAHGTGTSLGDPIEVGAASRAYGVGRGVDRPLLLGSVKANIGHLEAAAGVAGLIKVVLSLQAGELPGQVHFREPNPHVAWGSLPVEVVRARRAWPSGRRIAGISSFGFSGTNAHVIVEGYAEPVAAEPLSRQAQVLALSAKSGPALSALIERYAAFVAENASVSLADLCFTAGVGRNHFGHRASVVAETRDELVSGLAGLVPSAPRRGPARVGVLFTGQGSQWAGMAQGVYAGEPVFRDVVDRCCAAADALGLHARPLRAVLLAAAGTPEAALLDETAYTQVALYALQCGLWSLFRSWGIEAQAVLGHSVGEFAASYASGVLTLEDGARLVAQRGALMGRLPSGGAMAVVFAAPEAVTAAIERSKGLSLAAENGTHRVVSGPAALVDALVAEFTQAGVRCQRLTVSHAFHSALLDPMLDDLETAAASVTHRAPELALISNLTGSAFAPGTHPDAAYWRRHARAPVLFAQGVAALAAQGVDVLLELGPRPVLSGLALGCWPGVTPGSVPVALSALRPGVPDERALAEAVAGLYAAGGRVEFAGYAAGRGGRRIALPSYPFERVRHWMDAPRSHPRRDAGHPLLGVEHGSASGEVSWTQELSATEPGWVADHAVFGSVVAPGALHACLAAAAGGVPAAVRTGQIHAPLVLGEAPVTLQLLLAAADDAGQRGWRVFARPTRGAANGDSRGAANGDSRGAANGDSRGAANGGAPAETAWRLHASGMLSAATGAAPADAPLSGLAERNVEAFYASLAALGLDYGPSFRGIERLWGGDGVARGEIAAPDGVVGAALHPAVLDACFQVLMAALPRFAQDGFADGAARDPIVPLGWDAIEVWGPAPARVVCEARVRGSASGEAVVADLVLQDAAGAAFARVEGLLLKRTTRQAMLGAASGIDELLYEIAWRETEVPAFTAGFVAGPETAAAAVRPLLGALAAETGFDAGRHAAVETLLARASQVYAALALHRLGWSPAAGSVVTAPSLQAELGVLAEHTRLFARLLGLLGEAGLLTQAGESWRVVSWPDAEAAASALAPAAAPFAGEIAWVMLSRCGAALADVLRGRVAPLGLLFPEQDVGAAELYRDAPMFRLMNALLRSAVERLVAARPAGRRLRVLEVGAGTGGTTASLLPLLPRERTTYVYTDVSAGFFAAAETRFAQTYPFVEFRMLDIERDPVAQGFSAGGYDLVVASNVLHATRDLVATTSYCRSLLAPGGALVLLEEMRRRGWVDLTFGLLDGWWRFADPALRPEHALLDPAGWRTALHAAGYGEVATLHPDAAEVQGVVIARSPMQAAAAQAGLWLIAADTPRSGAGVGEALAAALAAHGQRVVLAGATDGPPEPSGSRPTNALIERRRVRPGDAADWRALLASLSGQAGGELRGVVHLAALDAGAADPTTPMLAQQAETVVGSALALSQALIGHDASPTAGLWFVTHGAQVVAGEPASGLAGAALWGMARSLAHEHPELHVRRLDLDAPAAQLAAPIDELVGEPVDELVDELVAALIDELMAPDAEDEIARRGPARLAPRLIRAGQPDADRLAIPADAGWRLAKGAERTLASLTTERVPLAPPGHGEVQVAIEAAGLNFRDVLDALGMVPVDAGPLGGEFAGRVLATGPGVTGFAPGDRVVGLGVGCFADRITTPAALLAPWPGDLPPAAAAALPIVYVTAAIAFELAGLRPGDRVLIHAGAGGVGLAAIALAQAAGAEIFATASAAKQATLRALGVRHVHDSRSTAFGPEILAATGGQGVDMVLNSLTGEGFIAATLSALAPGGRFVEIAKRGIWTHEAMAQARPDVAYHILAVDRLQAEQPEQTGAALRAVLARIGAGELPPLPYASTPMTDARAAMRHMQQARHIGKIVLTAPYVVASNVAAPIRPGVTYLITGGLGGIGLAVADWLADRGATHLALNGRRAPDAPAEAAVAALRARGTTVELILADVAKPTEVDRLIADIDARMPPLAGVIHSVGLLRDGAVANQDWTRFAEVLGPKMLGAWQLHRATRHRALDLFVLFASTVGVLGNRGQSNHAAANVFLDQLANHRRAQGLPGLSIDWGAWSDIGEAAERRTTLEASLQAAGIGWITPTQGLAALDRALASTTPQLAIVNAHWQTQTQTPLLTLLLETKQTQTKTKTQTTPITQRLNRLPQTQRRTELKTWLAQSIQKLLRLPQQPDTEMRFSELGLDSLMSVELRNRLNADLKLDPPLAATVLFDSPNLDALADTIDRHPMFNAPTISDEVTVPAATKAPPPPAVTAPSGIAIVGMACRFPLAPDLDAYWRLLVGGVDAVAPIPPERLDIAPSTEPGAMRLPAGLLDRVYDFDPLHFRISPDEAPYIDPQQRLLLETTWHALENAGLTTADLSGSKTGVFVGIGTADFAMKLANRQDALSAHSGAGSGAFAAANRISYTFDLTGPSMAVNTACASSLTALHLAVNSLDAGECDVALVGGVNLILHPSEFTTLTKANVLSPTGRCRSFSSDADGYVRGEGCGVLVLRRHADAASDGNRISAIVRGTALSHVGASNGMSAPNGPAQETVMRAAAARAGVDPADIDYLEAHGTGTNLGDAIEMGAIRRVMTPGRDPARPLRVGAVKSNIGNLEEASGMAGLIKTVLAMKHGLIPQTLHFRELNPNIILGTSPIRIVAQSEPWPAGSDHPRRAAVSSFGYGGVNAHAVLEEPPPLAQRAEPPSRPLLLTLRSRTAQGLRILARSYADAVADTTAQDLDRFCRTANTGRSELAHRLALVAPDREALVEQLHALAEGRSKQLESEAARGRRRMAFLFSGRDAADTADVSDLYRTEAVFRLVMDRCGDNGSLLPRSGAAAYARQSALAALWRSWGVRPDFVFGQGTAAVAAAAFAGVLTLEDGLALIQRLSQLVTGAAPAEAGAFAGQGGNGNMSEEVLDEVEAFAATLKHEAASIPLALGASGIGRQPAEGWPRYWREQIRHPAEVPMSLQQLGKAGAAVYVEIGAPSLIELGSQPGAVWLPSLQDGTVPAGLALAEALAALYTAGVKLDFAKWHADAGPMADIPLYPFERQRYRLEDIVPKEPG